MNEMVSYKNTSEKYRKALYEAKHEIQELKKKLKQAHEIGWAYGIEINRLRERLGKQPLKKPYFKRNR